MLQLIQQPWHWAVSGVLIGLMVPTLYILGGQRFGISRNLKTACAIFIPANLSYFKFNWKDQIWNLVFATGIIIGSFLAANYLSDGQPLRIADSTREVLAGYGVTDYDHIMPAEIFTFSQLFTLKGLFFIIIGGFLVGFGTRYAEGCTSGHAISGLAELQWPSLVATISFMVGGILTANFIVPIIFQLINS